MNASEIERLYVQAADACRESRELCWQMRDRRARTREEAAVAVEERVVREHADAAALAHRMP